MFLRPFNFTPNPMGCGGVNTDSAGRRFGSRLTVKSPAQDHQPKTGIEPVYPPVCGRRTHHLCYSGISPRIPPPAAVPISHQGPVPGRKERSICHGDVPHPLNDISHYTTTSCICQHLLPQYLVTTLRSTFPSRSLSEPLQRVLSSGYIRTPLKW